MSTESNLTLTDQQSSDAFSPAIKRMGAKEARNNFADLIGQVHYGGSPVIVERSGNPMVAVIPVAMLNRYLTQRERDLAIIDEIHAKMPDRPPEEVEQLVDEAITAVRAERRRALAAEQQAKQSTAVSDKTELGH